MRFLIIIFFVLTSNFVFSENIVKDEPLIPSTVDDLPLIELLDNVKKDIFIIILTGDGGWANIDRDVGNYFAKDGYGVIGFDCLKYFLTKRTPDETAKDIGRVIKYYSKKIKIDRVVIIGYSFGADVLPFVLNRLFIDESKKVKYSVFMGISNNAAFEFHLGSLVGIKDSGQEYRTLPEVKKINSQKLFFIAGEKEEDSLVKKLDRNKYNISVLKGGHHFGGNYKEIAKLIKKLIVSD
ncbi:MAG TPA: AcvB/VirJ family lysyl-phosphatidylglycerol hydrolase [Spirochaetota bacterium]|nr:AcvB/VirJ family lysyl-phosphatidylglycerol hydrolase [Spirochaetota bacterium]